MHSSDKPLRILVIVNLPWDSRLGAPRVWMELAEQWRAAGHTVEKFSLSDAFRDARAARVKFALRQMLFPARAAAFVRKNAHRFDVIDALIGTLPYAKHELGFRGLLVARSVGLYLLYDRFEQSVGERWPRRPRGRFLGRLLYRFTNRRLLAVSERSAREADLINVPNEEEAECLRKELGRTTRIIMQPYGLTAARREALGKAAQTAEARLAAKRVCFIGMWGARKGAYDWGRIIGGVRWQIPDACFRFLGTMIDDSVVQNDLASVHPDGIEFLSDYEPDDLPRLLSDCAVGAFPSYAEGFGLAVIEQLAAGIPTVAYCTAGPRDILERSLPELLVPSGDVAAMVAVICKLLRASNDEYQRLSRRCAEIEFSWPTIAADTLKAYRSRVEGTGGPILFVQPFSIGSAGGGARILRALLAQSPVAWRSICSAPDKARPWPNETNLPMRPSWGRIERSRFGAWPGYSAPLFSGRFRRRLRQRAQQVGARAIHVVAHSGLDFAAAYAVSRELQLPFFLSLHDDLAYTAAGTVPRRAREMAMREVWCGAAARFVISESLGREYCRRYGEREYHVVTDGLVALHPPRASGEQDALRIYFMGLFHMPYEENLRALLNGLELMQRDHAARSISVTLRCEHVRPQVIEGRVRVTVLPFADEAQVERDMECADLLYMPLPFGKQHENFARYSLSTKMVTYVGSGVPILYHGPASSAAFQLLSERHAALCLSTLDPPEIARILSSVGADTRATIATNALRLAGENFMLADQSGRFWSTITGKLAQV